MTEERYTDPNTGGQKGKKLERFDLVPVGPLREVARHYGVGAQKYDDRNWEKGYPWSLSFAALQRHAFAFWGGEENDEESGTAHLAAVVFHALALMEYSRTHPELDDRPKRPSLMPTAEEWRTYEQGYADSREDCRVSCGRNRIADDQLEPHRVYDKNKANQFFPERGSSADGPDY